MTNQQNSVDRQTYNPISEILAAMVEFHEAVSESCRTHEDDFDADQKRLLLKLLEQDQKKIRSVIKLYNDENFNAEAVKDWIQYIPQDDLKESVATVQSLKNPTLEELTAAVSGFYDVAAAFFQRIREQAASSEAQEFLDQLKLLEEQSSRKLTERLIGLRDI